MATPKKSYKIYNVLSAPKKKYRTEQKVCALQHKSKCGQIVCLNENIINGIFVTEEQCNLCLSREKRDKFVTI